MRSLVHSARFASCVIIFGAVFVSVAHAQQLTPGNLVIYRVGDGSGTLTTASTAVFIDQYNTGGGLVNTNALPSTGTSPFTAAGSDGREGYLTRSTNGLQIVMSGYSAVAGIADIPGSTVVQRIVGSLNPAGSFSIVGGFGSSGFSGSNIRGAAADGTNYWASGNAATAANAGIWYTNGTTFNQVSNSPISDTRNVNIFNGQLYFSTQTGTRGIYAVGTGLPTGTGTVSTLVIDTSAISSPVAFQFNTAQTVAYVADERPSSAGGIQKWVFSGGAWTLAYTLGTGVSGQGARGLVVDWSNPNQPTIFATSAEGVTNATRLFRIRDAGSTSTALTLATSNADTSFRGIDFALLPAVWTSSAAGTQNWSAGGATPWTNWSIGLVDGINLSFQNTNTGPDPLSITANNNTTLTNISSITFQATGFGGGDMPSYTLTGAGVTLGSATYAAGVRNDSDATQVINLNLTLGASQSFNANGGKLVFGGNINLGSGASNYMLTVTGSSDTLISGNIVDGGSGNSALVKTGDGTLTLTGNNLYSGGTTISGGVLIANSTSGNSSTGSGSVTVASGGTLRGGSVGGGTGGGALPGVITIQNGGTLAPGDAVATGQLKVANNVTFESGSAFTTRIQGLNAGVEHDQLLLVAGNVALDGTFTATFSVFSPTITDRIYVINNLGGGTLTGTFSNYTTSGSVVANYGGFDWLIYYNADSFTGDLMGGNDVVLVPVPEPAHLLLISTAGLGLGALVRRRLRRSTSTTPIAM